MSMFGETFRRAWYLLNRRRFERELEQEMDAHREMMRDPARFGNTLRLRERSRDIWGWTWADDFIRDLRLAARSLSRTPGFTSVAILSLVLGLTLAAAATAVADAYLVRSLPYPATDRLYHVMYAPPGPYEPGGMSALDWNSVSDVVEHAVSSAGASIYFGDRDDVQTWRALRVNAGFIAALGVTPVLGRSFTTTEHTPGSELVVMIGHTVWRDRFGGDSSIIGRAVRVTLGDRAETARVVGVLPPGFWFGRESRAVVDVLLPLSAPVRTYMVRLREGVPPSLAERRITEAARVVATNLKPDWAGVRLESAHERYVGQLRPVVLGVAFAAAIVLLIACTNVAVLVLLRALHRQKEMAVRVALGAGRRHIIRLLVAESALLCASAVALVVIVTTLTLRTLAPLIETQLGRAAPRGVSAIGIDLTMVAAIAGAGVIIAFSLCLVPLATPWQRRLADTLRGAGRHGTDRPAMQRLRSTLIGFELAASLVLLVGGGMMIRSVIQMVNADLGYRVDGVSRVRLMLPDRAYPTPESRAAFVDRITQRVADATRSKVALTNWPAFAESMAQAVIVEGAADARSTAAVTAVGDDYFDVLGIAIREGRAFTPVDRDGTQPVAIVSEALARRLWPASSAIGRRLRAVDALGTDRPSETWRTVVGIVRDVRQTYDDADVADIYVPYSQVGPQQYVAFYVANPAEPRVLMAQLRDLIATTDPSAIVRDVTRVADENRQLAGTRVLSAMLSAFAAFAAFLAVVGMYGVIAYAVRQRQHEFAIRIALGATRQAVTALSMRSGAVVLVIGLVLGAVVAAGAGRVLRNQLYGVPPFDIWSLFGAVALLSVAALVAIWWPARRAASVDPVKVLNHE